ncbi:MAG: PfkB family carbohydrate kinase [Treponema sp.]|nr:PfkB family carbohydrate kinase [Treponema sp.]
MSFLTVCLNPTLQKTLCFPSITPNAVNRTGVHYLDVSGKGINVTRVLTQLGKKAVHLTHLGCEMRTLFLSLCEQDGLAVNWVESNSQIRFCYTVIDESSGEVTELVEEAELVSPQTETHLLEKFDSLLEDASPLNSSSLRSLRLGGFARNLSCVIISGTKAAGYSDTVIPDIVHKAKEKGLRIILDIKGKDLIESLKYEPDVIKPNIDEFIETFGLGKECPRKSAKIPSGFVRGLMLELAQKHRCRIILTNGSKKILTADKNNYNEIDPTACAARAVNTTGCGDAFTAGLAAALESKADINTAINEGIRCGALNAALLRPGVIM